MDPYPTEPKDEEDDERKVTEGEDNPDVIRTTDEGGAAAVQHHRGQGVSDNDAAAMARVPEQRPSKPWVQPFLRSRFSPRDVARVLSHTRPFEIGSRCVESCRSVLDRTVIASMSTDAAHQTHEDEGNEERDDPVPNPMLENVRIIKGDYWGRDDIIKLGGNTIMFTRDVKDRWNRAVLDDSTFLPNSKKRKLDLLAKDVYLRRVLSKNRGLPSEKLKHLFVTRAESALQNYCTLKRWTYGRDLLLISSGGSVDCMHRAIVSRMSPGVFPAHSYEVLVRNCDDLSAVRDIKLLMLHVVYAVETLMRDSPKTWGLRDTVLQEELGLFRAIDAEIVTTRSSLPPRKDSSGWIVRGEDGCVEATVIKPADCLAWSMSKKNDLTTVQGLRREIKKRDSSEGILPLFVSCVSSADGNGDGGRGATVKLRYDIAVEVATSCPGPSVKCGADVLTVRVIGSNESHGMDFLSAPASHFFTDVGGVYVPNLYVTWHSCMRGFFEWLNDPRAAIDPDTARTKAQRLIWAAVSLDVQLRQWAMHNRHSPSTVPICMGEACTMLMTLNCALTLAEDVTLGSVDCLPYPFMYILRACEEANMPADVYQRREWIKAVLSSAIVTVSAKLNAAPPPPPPPPRPFVPGAW